MIDAFCSNQVREQAFAMSQQDRVLSWTDGAYANNKNQGSGKQGVESFMALTLP